MLAQIALEERRKRAGRIKVFLGYAVGVGESFQMFDKAVDGVSEVNVLWFARCNRRVLPRVRRYRRSFTLFLP